MRNDSELYVVQATLLARTHHKGQTDVRGVPYITHLERVTERLRYCDWQVRCVGWLHDIVEDTDMTLAWLAELFPTEIVDAIDAITHREHEPLESYWTRVKSNPIALIVKLHGDMPDNNDPARWIGLTDDFRDRIGKKYARAIKFLTTPERPPTAGNL